MRGNTGWAIRVAGVGLVLAASVPSAPSHELWSAGALAPVLAQATPPAKCCFTNPRYAGTCEVEPAKDESCGQILGYLNNPMSQGKSYCGNTAIRGGWQSVACESKR